MERRLAAILAADVVGYARLMERDEAGTLVALKSRRREILQPTVSKHHGRIVKVMGDGVLVEFASVVDAVSCAVELQDAMTVANEGLSEDRQIVLRIGVNLGDVIVEGGDLYGDGVNIAARLEALAEPGIILVSHAVFGQVRGKVPFGFDDMGEQSLKNLAEPLRVYRVGGIVDPASGEIYGKPTPTSKLSIAVVPFTNMSGDPEQEYFSDGITEDIITDLSQVSALFVVARNTVFTFKGKAVEIAQVARKLNVGYVLEGSVRKAGSRIRISVQLIDGATGGHVWAARYDREFGDIFALQDDISKNVVAALKVRLLPEELNAINSRSTANAEAYQHYLLGRSSFSEAWGNKHLLRLTRQMFAKAAEIDPGYARAYAGIADCDTTLWIVGDIDVSYESILANSTVALGLAPNLAEAHASKGFALYWSGHSDEASVAFERAIELDPELFEGYFYYATACRETGRFDKAAALFKRAAELRHTDFIALALLGDVYKSLGLTNECVAAARRSMDRIEAALAKRPNDSSILAWGAAVMVYFGENARAEDWANRAIALSPEDYYVRYNVACTYAVIGKPEAAVECLQFISLNVPRARRWLLGIANHDTQMNSLRDRPDYRAFMKRLEADISEHS